MAENTEIQWCTCTFSPWRGCMKVSEGCKNCYAEALVTGRQGLPVWGQDAERKIAADSTWKQVARWNRKAGETGEIITVFPSLCDVFEDYRGPMREAVMLARLRYFHLLEDTPNLTHFVLTKRPEMVAELVPPAWLVSGGWPRNVWLGFSAENQARFDERWVHAKQIPAPVIFTSIEPQLGPVVLPPDYLARGDKVWPICGGESGHKSRTFIEQWAHALVAQCSAANVPIFVKQMGARPVSIEQCHRAGGKIEVVEHPVSYRHHKGGDIEEWAPALRVRQMPTIYGPAIAF